jgi:hypothetical protein
MIRKEWFQAGFEKETKRNGKNSETKQKETKRKNNQGP